MKDIKYAPITKLHIENVGYLSVVRKKGYSFNSTNGKEVFSFVYVDEGSVGYTFAGKYKSLQVNKGEMIFVPKHVPYTVKYLSDNSGIKLFSFDIEGELPFVNAPFVKKSNEISTVFLENNREALQNFLLICSSICKLIYILSYDEDTVSKQYKKILPAVKDIEVNYFENRKISDYAKLTDMSESNFRRLFKEYTGKSVIEYRNEIRLTEVNKMLLSGEYNVSEAAYAAGFNNMSFFYELYRKYNKNK